ncbi:MAG: RimK family alpha-L-glutamate ligase [Candidatus Bathyarchaeia archaeon]
MIKVGFVVALRALVIIGRSFDDNNKQLYRACKELIHETYLARIMNMSASVSSESSRFWVGYREVKDVDVCFLRSFDAGSYEQIIRRIGLVRHLSETGTFVVNPLEPLLIVRDKYSTLFTLAKYGLPIPETYVTESAHWAYRKTQKLKQTVYKPISGALGFGAMKFDDSDLAFNAYKRLEELGVPLYVQEYLENQQRDIRAFVVGDQVIAAMYRIASKNHWKTNIALGNEPKPLKLSKNLANMAVKATRALGLIYAGVDMLETKNGPVLLEVNGSPSWQGLGRVSGVDVAKVLVKHVLGLIKH